MHVNTSLLSRLLLVLALVGTFALAAPELLAQEDGEVEQAAEAAPEGESVLELIQIGGIPMYFLLALLMATIGLTIYNFMALREKAFLVPGVVDDLEPKMAGLDIQGARQMCEDNPAPVTNILLSGLDRATGETLDVETIEKAMEEASTDELAAPFGMVSYLNAIATISPMIGLLGTVLGMVQAFQNIAAQGFGQPQVLAEDIQMALITTAGGLIVALPAMLMYLFFKNRYTKLASGVSREVGDLFHTMVRGARGEITADDVGPAASESNPAS
jgi:biopolymer transport protein ExbB